MLNLGETRRIVFPSHLFTPKSANLLEAYVDVHNCPEQGKTGHTGRG